MPSERSRRPLFDIRDNIRLAQQFVSGLDQPTVAADRKTFYAVTRCLELISEAARRVTPDIKARHLRAVESELGDP